MKSNGGKMGIFRVKENYSPENLLLHSSREYVWSTEHTWVGKLVGGWFTEKCLFYGVWKIRREDTRMKNKVDRSLFRGGKVRKRESTYIWTFIVKDEVYHFNIHPFFLSFVKRLLVNQILPLSVPYHFEKFLVNHINPMNTRCVVRKTGVCLSQEQNTRLQESHSWLSHSAHPLLSAFLPSAFIHRILVYFPSQFLQPSSNILLSFLKGKIVEKHDHSNGLLFKYSWLRETQNSWRCYHVNACKFITTGGRMRASQFTTL